MRASSDLGLMMPEIHLFHSRRKFKRYIRKLDRDLKALDTEGQMAYCDGTAVILMAHSGRAESELSLLVHEAYHAAVAHMEYLGEDSPGEEVMAYLVQSIAHALFVAHGKWKRRKKLL